jgi:hypothetical protein
MRKLFTQFVLSTAFIAALTSNQAQAQVSDPKACGTHYYYQELYSKHPGLKERDEAFDAALAEYIKTIDVNSLEKTRAGEKIIPVVFHIIHDYGTENIPDANIYDQMRILNEDFNKRNADTAGIVPAFKPLIGDAKIKFMLARKDPQGNCTNGIDRIQSYKTRNGSDVSKLNPWSRNYYFNVWIVNSIGAQGVAGYAYKPQSLNGGFLNMYDGIIILYDYVGSLSPAQGWASRALTHEFGHSLGLDHTWGATNDPAVSCGDDGVSDTPPTEGHDNCNATQRLYDTLCGVGSQTQPGPLEMMENYMEYSYCATGHLYSIGQCNKMNDVSFVQGNASRNLLITDLAHQVSGVFDTITACAPVADFINRRYFTCLGVSNVTLNGATTNLPAGAATYAWSIPNSPANNATTTTVTNTSFTAPGWQPISVTATASNGTSTKAKNNKVYVSDPAATLPANYGENFEQAVSSDKWPIFNFYDNYFGWNLSNSGYDFGKCIKMNTYDDRPAGDQFTGTPTGDADEFISPAWDLASLVGTETRLSFVSSGATNTSNYSDVADSLRIYYSTSCGSTWTQLTYANVINDQLFNKLQAAPNYAPTSNSDWVWRSYVIPDGAKSAATYFRFRYKSSDYSNNLYIDNIAVGTWATGVKDATGAALQMNVVPNPNQGSFNITLSQQLGADVEIADVTGKIIHVVKAAQFNSNGASTVQIDVPSGVYFATARVKGAKLLTQKFVVSN